MLILLLIIFVGGGTGIYFYINSKKCKPKCKECGDDGCGGDCGSCPSGSSCNKDGLCVTKKDNNCSCEDKTCGFDGCGNSCGTCKEEEKCSKKGQCYTPNCQGKKCGDDDGYGGKCVVPDCEGKKCDDDDGCGGVCGCPNGKRCYKGECCSADCGDNNCGSICGKLCGKCTDKQICKKEIGMSSGKCCTPSCDGIECGLDSCGLNQCKGCPAGQHCTNGKCKNGTLNIFTPNTIWKSDQDRDKYWYFPNEKKVVLLFTPNINDVSWEYKIPDKLTLNNNSFKIIDNEAEMWMIINNIYADDKNQIKINQYYDNKLFKTITLTLNE